VNRGESGRILERMMALHPKVIDLSLDRVLRLLGALGNPERAMPPAIHIAGTNGKGSTLAMIRAGMEGAGRTVHVYTSPHLTQFHERIRLAGKQISEERLVRVLDECRKANGGKGITYFEITTAAAFLAFSRTPADFVLLETGLGGRLDATNVIARPALTIIAPISMDHERFLGDRLTGIAEEKAGILKPGVTCVVGPQPDEVQGVIEARALRMGAPLIAHGRQWHVREERGRLIYRDEDGVLDLPRPALPGAHQVSNAGLAIAALRTHGFGEGACRTAMTEVEWPARMQRLRTGPLVRIAGGAELWLDGGHNPAAGAALADLLRTLPPRPTHLICGMMNSKDADGYLRPLAAAVDSLVAVPIPGEENSLTSEAMVRAASHAGIRASAAADVSAALARIVADEPRARVTICGSLHLAGTVLRDNG